jgi:hypothetical protein
MDTKKCSRCKTQKSREEFHKSNITNDKLQAFCKICNSEATTVERRQFYNERRKVRRQNTEYRQRELDKGREHRIKYREKYLLRSAKFRHQQQNIPFNLTLEDIVIPEYCPILKVPLTRDTMRKKDWNAPSIDKIIPELGYVKGNIMIISLKANLMKNNASKEELLNFAEFFLKFWKK